MAAMQQRTPTWLAKNGLAAKLFQSEAEGAATLGSSGQAGGAVDGLSHLPMAARDNEIFYVVDRTVRWANLAQLKEQNETQSPGDGQQSGVGYRTLNLKRSFNEPIQQLVVSPNEDLMAVVTRHSVSVVILPDSSLWNTEEETPINVRRHTVGETTHVWQTPAIAKVLWHPLGLDGNCLVTVTVSSVVRLWELDRRNLASFSVPALAIDLQKLRHAKSQEEDTGSQDMTFNKAFSIDDVEMEVTSACFGSNPIEAQAFEWSAATLWLTMAEGDIFALCPLLPSRFMPDDDGTISTLFELKSAQKQSLDAEDAFGPEKARVQSQCSWLRELHEQYQSFEDSEYSRRVYTRPVSQGSVPRLQGPFVILPNDIQDDLIPCDIHVIGASTAAMVANRDIDSESEEEIAQGISFSTVSILGEDGRVHICVDVDGVEPQWLPLTKRLGAIEDGSRKSELLLVEALDTLSTSSSQEEQFPMFTANTAADEYSFFVSHRKGIYKFSLDPWVHELEKELQHAGTEGVQFRAQVLVKGPGTKRERVFKPDPRNLAATMASPVLLSTEELGHLLMIVQGQQAHAVVFSDPGAEEEPLPLSWKPGFAPDEGIAALSGPDREVYYPPPEFTQPSTLGSFMERQVEPRYKRLMKDEIRLSSATLSIMTEAHRVLSRETTALNDAAADLFRRCDRLHDEFKHQVEKMAEVADRVRAINEVDSDYEDDSNTPASKKQNIEERLKGIKENHSRLVSRHDRLRQKLLRAGGKPESNKEKAWHAEVYKIEASVDAKTESTKKPSERQALLLRCKDVQALAEELLQQARANGQITDGTNGSTTDNGRVPPDIRRGKVGAVQELLERESALIDAAMVKLVRLGVAGED